MVAVSLQVRRAVLEDQKRIADLMFFESHIHRHLDWRPPLDWLGEPDYWVLEEGRSLAGVLACPPDPPGIAWIRLFACTASPGVQVAWSTLWERAARELSLRGSGVAAAIALHPWMEDLLEDSNFAPEQDIIMLHRDDSPLDVRPPKMDVTLRPMRPTDLPEVVEVDSAAFDPLWRNSQDALEKALLQASYASVAETVEGIVGYQLSTGSLPGMHLARLAVLPGLQGGGIGSALVHDLLKFARAHGRTHITVNTQSDNFASQALYKRLGFILTGERFPVFIHPF